MSAIEYAGRPVAIPRARAQLRLLLRFLGAALSGIALTVLVGAAMGGALGFRSFVVLTGSMRPAFDTGDAVVSRRLPARELRAGDIATFNDPGRGHRLVTHRVRAVWTEDGRVRVVTKGDANNTVERWSVPEREPLARVVARVPKAGYAIAWLQYARGHPGPARAAGGHARDPRARAHLAAPVTRRSAWIGGVLAAFALAAVLVTTGGGVHAAFTSTTGNGGNSLSAAPDWVAPTASASVIGKTAGGSAGYVKPGGSCYVYAATADTGNPASGVATVTVDVATVTSGQTAASLAAGSFTADGASYDRRSGSLTAGSPLADGSYSYSLTLTDGAGNARTATGYTVTVDGTAPSAADIQATNGTGTAQRPDQGDVVTFAYSETVDADSILSGWTGSSTSVVVRIVDGGLLGNDLLQVWNAADAAQLPLGEVNLGDFGYVSATNTYGATGTPCAMVRSNAVITVTLGTASGASSRPLLPTTMAWTPSSTATDRAGNASSTATRNETGGADIDF